MGPSKGSITAIVIYLSGKNTFCGKVLQPDFGFGFKVFLLIW